MNSPKTKTQQHRTKVKNLSTLMAVGLALVTLFQAGTVRSEKVSREMSIMEVELLAEVDQWFAEEEMTLEEALLSETVTQEEAFKVFDTQGNLLAEGNPQENEALRKLVNQAEFMSEFSGAQYYSLTK